MNVRMQQGKPAYSHVVTVTGPAKTVYIAGQLARDAAGNIVGPGDMRAQLEQTFKNLDLCLKAAGATWADVVKTNTFVTNYQEFSKHSDVRMRYFGVASPTSTTIQISGLAQPEAMVEIEMIAVVEVANRSRDCFATLAMTLRVIARSHASNRPSLTVYRIALVNPLVVQRACHRGQLAAVRAGMVGHDVRVCAPRSRQTSITVKWFGRLSCCPTSKRRSPGSLRLAAVELLQQLDASSFFGGTAHRHASAHRRRAASAPAAPCDRRDQPRRTRRRRTARRDCGCILFCSRLCRCLVPRRAPPCRARSRGSRTGPDARAPAARRIRHCRFPCGCRRRGLLQHRGDLCRSRRTGLDIVTT